MNAVKLNWTLRQLCLRVALISCVGLLHGPPSASALSTPHEEEVQRAPASQTEGESAGSSAGADERAQESGSENSDGSAEPKPLKHPHIEMKSMTAPVAGHGAAGESEDDSSDQMTIVMKKAAPAKETLRAAKEAKTKVAATAAAPAHGGHGSKNHGASTHDEPVGVPAATALKWLQNGNSRFVKKQYRADGRDAKDRARLASGQAPHAIVLSCSDSRVPPEIVFDQALGEIFVIRVAGQALSPSVIASIEYAVAHLGSKLLVVMGHTSCGAVKATISLKEGDSAGSTALDALVEDIKPRLKTLAGETLSPNLEVESALNADGVARDLVKRSEIIRGKVKAGELLIKSALYRLDSGKVSFY